MQDILIFWIIVAIVSFIIEINTATFFAIWFGIGALISLVFNLFGSSISLQIVVFVISSIALTLSSEFILKKKLNILKKPYRTNIESVVGKVGIVTKEVTDLSYNGEVMVDGKYWSAVSEDGTKIPPNTKVIVVKVDGVKLVVRKLEN